MHTFLMISGLVALAILINLPLGYLRQGYEKFTFGWYFYIHISIPFLIYLRVKAGYSWKLIPLTLGGAVVGQLLGGIIQRRRNNVG
ncbi:MAG: hypothetical protein ED859_02140 [Desulfuromonadales bacterium]|nr:MAG: hypothetical protein ED859_02140 [Desulfuromonadales bacterium]